MENPERELTLRDEIAVLKSQEDLRTFLGNGGFLVCVKPSEAAIETLQKTTADTRRIEAERKEKDKSFVGSQYCTALVDDESIAKQMFQGQKLPGKPVIGLSRDNLILSRDGKVLNEFADWDDRLWEVFDEHDGIDENSLTERAFCVLFARDYEEPAMEIMRKAAKKWSSRALMFLWTTIPIYEPSLMGQECPSEWPRVVIRTEDETYVLWENAKEGETFSSELVDRFVNTFYREPEKLAVSKAPGYEGFHGF